MGSKVVHSYPKSHLCIYSVQRVPAAWIELRFVLYYSNPTPCVCVRMVQVWLHRGGRHRRGWLDVWVRALPLNPPHLTHLLPPTKNNGKTFGIYINLLSGTHVGNGWYSYIMGTTIGTQIYLILSTASFKRAECDPFHVCSTAHHLLSFANFS